MELFLNLAWLLLALPAYWLWRSTLQSQARRKLKSLHCLLALACMLVVLFPVISATDDLHAMRTEMEETPASKRSLHQASTDKASPWNSQPQTPPAILGATISIAVGAELLEGAPVLAFSLPAVPTLRSGRAPPASHPA
ncbi:MAG: hypothetical protein WAN03_01340 [Candidatus Sulfotelmatobacter sp.]